jgi:hypothetical protein
MKRTLSAVLLLVMFGLVVAQIAAQNTRATVPVLTLPIAGETVNTYSPLLNWENNGADSYKVIVKNAAGTKILKVNVNPIETCDGACIVSPVNEGVELLNGIHTWRVIAKDADGKAKSEVRSFTVDFPGAPILITPIDDAQVGIDPILEWEVGNDAFAYKVKVKNTDTGATFKTEWTDAFEICLETCAITSTLGAGNYNWLVQARYDNPIYVSKSAKATFSIPAVR